MTNFTSDSNESHDLWAFQTPHPPRLDHSLHGDPVPIPSRPLNVGEGECVNSVAWKDAYETPKVVVQDKCKQKNNSPGN